MMIKEIYENAIRQIEADRARNMEVVRQNVMREKVAPFNADIDTRLREALAELQEKHNANIAQLQRAYETEAREMTEAANKRKQEFLESAIATETAAINAEADNAIKHLKEFIGNEG